MANNKLGKHGRRVTGELMKFLVAVLACGSCWWQFSRVTRVGDRCRVVTSVWCYSCWWQLSCVTRVDDSCRVWLCWTRWADHRAAVLASKPLWRLAPRQQKASQNSRTYFQNLQKTRNKNVFPAFLPHRVSTTPSDHHKKPHAVGEKCPRQSWRKGSCKCDVLHWCKRIETTSTQTWSATSGAALLLRTTERPSQARSESGFNGRFVNT